MPGQPYKIDDTDSRYVSGSVTTGQLVMPDTTVAVDSSGKRLVKTATAGATTVIGVARLSATNTANADTTFVHTRPSTTIFRNGQMFVTYAAAAEEGQYLVAAANGAVTPYTSGTSTFDQIVGKCAQKVTAAGEGLAWIAC